MKRTSLGILLVVVAVAVLLTLGSAPVFAQQTGTNWTGTYYSDVLLQNAVTTEAYPSGLYFNWGGGPPLKSDNITPVPGMAADNFSARFTSTQVFAQAGTYTFTLYVDDGARVIINGANVLDQFNANPGTGYRTFTFTQNFAANQSVSMVVEYVEYTGSSVLVFQWGVAGGPGGISPTAGPSATAVPAATGTIHTVRGNALRTGPYLGASMVGVVRPDIAFAILEQNFDEGLFPWYKIQDNHGRIGWVSGRYLRVAGDLSKIPTTRTIFEDIDNPTDLPRLLDVTGYTRSTMNFRRRPSQRTDLLGQIPWGDAVQVIGRTVQGGQNFWLQVRYKDVVGWIYAPFVKLEGVVDAVPIR